MPGGGGGLLGRGMCESANMKPMPVVLFCFVFFLFFWPILLNQT